MNDLASTKLCEIVAQYGPDVCDEPRRLRSLLMDVCPGMPRQVNTLVAAAEQQVVAELRGSAATLPWSVLSGRLVRRLVEETAMAEPDAQWVVAAWGKALGCTDALPAASVSVPVPDGDSDRKPVSAPPAPPSRSLPLRLLLGLVALAALAGVGYLIYRASTQQRPSEPPSPPAQVEEDKKDRGNEGKGEGAGKTDVTLAMEIESLREELARLEHETRRHFDGLAEQEVSIAKLKDDIESMRTNLERQQQNMRTMRDALEASNAETITYGGTRYTRKQLQNQLERDVASHQRAQVELKARENLLEAKSEALNEARAQLDALRDARDPLRQKIETLEAERLAIQGKPSRRKFHVDDTPLSRVQKELEKVKNRIEIENERIELVKEPELVVYICSAAAASKERWYRIGEESLTLEEVKTRLKKQKDGPTPSVQLRLVLSPDSPGKDSPIVNDLLQWARANRFATTFTESKNDRRP